MTKSNPHFSPNWDDGSVLLPESLLYPLIFPKESPRTPDKAIWVTSRMMRSEEWHSREVVLEKPRKAIAVMRPSTLAPKGRLIDEEGNVTDEKSRQAFLDIFFPPRAWMTDTLIERSMMLLAAREAKGKVLVGGLGLGIYPQIALYIKRPISSITIVEASADVIELVEPGVLKFAESYKVPIKIVNDTIENFMQQTENRYDTVYMDTWGDLHYKFLAYINYLVSLATKIATPQGKIQCWGYNFMYKQLLKVAEHLETEPTAIEKLLTKDNACLKAYWEWRQTYKKLSINTVRANAARIAAETIDPTPLDLFVDTSNSPAYNRLHNLGL